jgi:hypothetical protein
MPLADMAAAEGSATTSEAAASGAESAIRVPQSDVERAALIQKAKRIFKGEKLDDPEAQAAVAKWTKKAYIEELPEDIGDFRSLLQDYSKVPPEEVEPLLRSVVRLDHLILGTT